MVELLMALPAAHLAPELVDRGHLAACHFRSR
jgi:hypothetical protein